MKIALRLIIFALVLTFTSCIEDNFGPGEITSTKRSTPIFDKVKVVDGFQVEIIRGNYLEVVVEAPEGYQQDIYTEVNKDGELCISLDKDINPLNVKHKKVFITMPTLRSITAWGGSEAYTTGTFTTPIFYFDADGGSYIEANITGNEANVIASARSDVKLVGDVDALYVDELSGNSKLYAFDLYTNLCELNLLGGSEAHVTTTQKLVVTASEASIVKYAGHPNIVHSLTGGSLIIYAN